MLITNWGKRREVRDFLEEHVDYIPAGWADRIVPPPAEHKQWVAPKLPVGYQWRNVNSLLLRLPTRLVTFAAFAVLLLAILIANPVIMTNLAVRFPPLQRLASVTIGPRLPRWAFSVAIFQAAGVESILAAMSAHRGDADVQGNACTALSNLADATESRGGILQAGGIRHIIDALQTHPADAYVQAGGCGALWSIAMNNAARVAISQAGGIRHVVQAMRHHPGDHYVQAEACGALWGLASNVDNRNLIEQEGGIEIVVAAMKDHLLNEMVQRQACGVLGHLASGSLARRNTIAKTGGVVLILEAMQKHPKDTWVRRNACSVLMHFMTEQELTGLDVHKMLADAGLKCSDF
jgi:hypothetical protein